VIFQIFFRRRAVGYIAQQDSRRAGYFAPHRALEAVLPKEIILDEFRI